MNLKMIIVFVVAILLLLSGLVVLVEGETAEGIKIVNEEIRESEPQEAKEIHDWYDLDSIRDDLDANYVLMNDLDEDTDGYDEIASGEANPLNDRDEWAFGLEYEIGDLVYIDIGDLSPTYFYCIRPHTSDLDNEPIEGGNWKEYWVETDKQGEDELGFRPIGILDDNEFYGDFDGNGYKIEDIVIKREDEDFGGLFRACVGEIHDLHLEDFEIDINSWAGSLVGYLTGNGFVENCSAENIEIEGYRGSLEEELRTFIGGLIGRASGESEIRNSHVKNIDATAPGELGGLAGRIDVPVENCYAKNVDITGDAGRNTAFRTGGFVGCVYFSGDVRNCYVDDGTVTGDDEIGGFTGSFRTSLLPMPYIENCYADVDVDGEDWVGGFTGVVNSNTHGLHNSYALGDVQGNQYVGGFVGAITNGSEITNCYSIGDVTGNSDVSGFGDFSHIDLPSNVRDEEIEGKSIEGDENVEDCYWDTKTSDMDTSELGEGKTTEEMTGEDALNNIDGFDFEEIWKTVEKDNENANEDGYPILRGISREVQFEAQGIYEEEYTLTITIEGEGTTDPSEGTQTYEKGIEVEVEAIPDEGYEFDEWTGDYEGEEKEIDVVMDEHKEITVHFKEVVEEHDLIFEVEDEEGYPIENASVEINNMEERTDENGQAVFENLEDDTYEYEVSHDGYQTDDGEVEMDEEVNTVTLTPKEDEIATWVIFGIIALGVIILVGVGLIGMKEKESGLISREEEEMEEMAEKNEESRAEKKREK